MEQSQQEIVNNAPIDTQVNIGKVENVHFSKKSRWQKRFEKLREEVRNDLRYSSFIDDFHRYNTIRDGIGLEQKLIEGGFSEKEIIKALDFKERYARRVVKGEMYQTQQEIDVEIFSKIDANFTTYVYPKIIKGCDKDHILECLLEKVIEPILNILDAEGEADEYLKYNSNDIYGMVYFLTGKCHLNWKDNDII